jgi:ribosome maturation factor RimP
LVSEWSLSGQNFLDELVAPVVEAAGYRLVRLRVMGAKRKTLQVMAERPDGQMDVDDCATLSRRLSEVLEAADPIADEYTLEVSSPGIDRPLFGAAQFARWIGEQAKLSLRVPQDGRRRLQGKIARVEGDRVVIAEEKIEYTVAEANIEKAKLVPDFVALGLAAQPKPSGRKKSNES